MAAQDKKAFKVVFMGTPEFSRVILEALIAHDGCEVIAAYSQPDRPCGRGQVCKPTEVKKCALEHGIPVHQPLNFKEQSAIDELAALEPDLLVVAAYGLILPQAVLDIAPCGAMNVHTSLLPKYRGAAPIQRAILNGDDFTGVTIMQMDKGMDTGDILLARALAIGMNDTAETLHDELAALGGRMITEAIERLKEGRLAHIAQDDAEATYADKLKKSEGELDWSCSAQDVHNRARAMFPWPGAYFFWQGEGRSKALRISIVPGELGPACSEYGSPEPGTIVGEVDGKLAIACADRLYLVPSVKPAGKKSMEPQAFLCGYMQRCATK
ncbi:methionyl-tRNA formyltransferase [Desulfobaculum bizertense]|uniref:methionyl-tRNA formyltransferase n=1 Tax=Desulfobaculum bizertense TaxID=376490 RepID=UPI001EED1187|nr:methionyl-tRNA formyltransferase [Desulfobaculum bizertense]UIJ37476.1 methionyl-tRNA formyltransferase [Desulfobaculum bizertense]